MRLRGTFGIRAFNQHIGQGGIHRLGMLVEPGHQLFGQTATNGIVTALNHLVEAGYESVSYFKKRERIDIKISEVISSIKRAADANS